MAAGDLALNLLINGNAGGAQAAIGMVTKSLSMLASGNVLGAVGGLATAASVAIVGIGVASVKAAGDFQEGVTTLVTSAGESKNAIGLVSDGILKMAVDTGTSTKQLTDGMFMIESAGYRGAAGLQVLDVAAKGAKVGNADLGVTANALTTILTDYHLKTTQAADAMNGLTAVVANGKTHLQDVATAMGNVLPLASSLHISFAQVGGAISTMTNAGMSAQRASMNLANAIRSLSAPGSTAQKAMKDVGISAQQLHDTLATQGLTGALQLVEQHVGKTFPAGSVQATAAMKAIMGGATGLNVSLMLGGKNMQNFTANVAAVGNAMKDGKGQVTGWADVQQDFNFKIAQAKEVLETLMIHIGTQLLPVIGSIVQAIVPVITSFSNWLSGANALSTGLGNFSGMVSGFFQTMSQRSITSTLDMQKQTTMHTLQMAKENVANLAQQAQGIELQMEKAHTAVAQHSLAMQLTAVQHAQAQQQGVVQQYAQQAKGIQAQLDKINPAVQLQTLKAKDTAVSTTIAMTQRTIAGYGQMAAGIEDQMKHAHTSVQKHALAAQLAAVLAAQKQKEGVLKQLEGQRQGIETQMKGISTAMKTADTNPLLLAWQGIQTAWGHVVQIGKQLGQFFMQDILPILKQVGGFLAANFAPVWKQLVDLWQKQLMPLFKQMQPALGPILTVLGLIAALILGLLVGALAGAIKGIAGFLSGLIIVIGGVMQFFTGLVQFVGGILGFFVDLFTGNFSNLGSDLGMIWAGIVNMFFGVWQVICGIFQTAWYTISGLVTGFVDGIKGFFIGLYDDLVGHSIIPDMINGIINWIGQLPGRAMAFISDLVSKITGSLSNLGSMAMKWGGNLIQGFLNGIKNAASGIGNFINNNVLGPIKSFLGFGSPTEMGEGRHILEWGANMVGGFVAGMQQAMPLLNAQVSHMIQAPNSLAYGSASHGGASAGNAFGLGGGHTIIVQVQPATAAIHLDGKKVGESTMKYVQKEVRIQGNVRNK